MSTPHDHHHNAVFTLRRFADPADGKVCTFKRVRGEIAVKRRAPKFTGYEKDLYAVPSRASDAERQALETKYLKPIDDAAARALEKLEAPRAMHIELSTRDAWIAYLLSLLCRSTRGVAHLRQLVGEAPLSEDDQALRDEMFAGLFLRTTSSRLIGDQLARMQWAVLRSDAELVVGDDPLLLSHGLNHADSFVALPIGPDRYFVAANSRETITYLGGEAAAGRLAIGFNGAQAAQAAMRVWARSPIHAELIGKHLGRRERSGLNHLTWKLP